MKRATRSLWCCSILWLHYATAVFPDTLGAVISLNPTQTISKSLARHFIFSFNSAVWKSKFLRSGDANSKTSKAQTFIKNYCKAGLFWHGISTNILMQVLRQPLIRISSPSADSPPPLLQVFPVLFGPPSLSASLLHTCTSYRGCNYMLKIQRATLFMAELHKFQLDSTMDSKTKLAEFLTPCQKLCIWDFFFLYQTSHAIFSLFYR